MTWPSKIMFALFVAVGIGVTVLFGYRATAISPAYQDVAYADVSDRNELDIYLPSNSAEPKPLVVLVHGGGFRFGDKARPSNLQVFLDADFAVAAINYRLSGDAIWPAQRTDVSNAIKYLHDNAGSYGLDPLKIGVFGQSAGAHLAVSAAIDLFGNEHTYIKGVVDWFGPIDFTTMDADLAASGNGTSNTNDAGSFESRLIGAPVGENPDLARKASPLYAIKQLPDNVRLPPFLIMHGSKDPLIAARQSERLRDALEASPANGGVSLQILPGGTHGGGDFKKPAAIEVVIDFFDRTLKSTD